MDVLERYDISPEQAWLATLVVGLVSLVGGSLLFPKQVYDGFIWRYFWGPIHADARGANCVVREPGSGTTEVRIQESCDPSTVGDAIVATPGYTVTSTLSYMAVLVFMLVGAYFLLQRLDIEPYREFFYSLVPFMLFGGALRTVEDSFVFALRQDVTPLVTHPYSSVLISPIIYFTVFVLALLALLVSKFLEGRYTDTYQYPLGGIGLALLVGTFAYLLYFAETISGTHFYPLILLTILGLATGLSLAVFFGLDRFYPEVHEGTGYVGLVIIWGHAIDGVANVLAADWTGSFGLARTYSAKHPLNRFIIDATHSLQPAELTALVGDSWPFLPIKLAVAAAILVLFDEEFLEESRLYAYMLLAAILAVGLGPGTRDMLRVSIGI